MTALGPVGFGAYRVADGIPEHEAALEAALDRGCRLIDTAPHYAAGRSEALIGRVLRERTERPFVITKCGYVPDYVASLLGVDGDVLPRLPDGTGYSLDPAVVRASTALSRARLGVATLDAVCLHNPEHLSEVDAGGWTRERIDESLSRAFDALEQEVAAGRIGCYGVSSGLLSKGTSREQLDALEHLLTLVQEAAGHDHHLRILQFPWNLLEQPSGPAPLFEAIAEHGLVSVTHRALNATWRGAQVRLADTPLEPPSAEAGRRALDHAAARLDARLREAGVDHSPWDFAAMQFLRDRGDAVDHPDLVDLVFERQVEPFVREVFGDGPDGAASCAAFAAVHDHARACAAARLSDHGARLRAQLVSAGRIDPGDRRPLALIAASHPLESGADCVLLGMRRPDYVAQLAPLFDQEAHERDEERTRVQKANERRAARRGYLVFATDPERGPDEPGYREVFATEARTPAEATAKVRPLAGGRRLRTFPATGTYRDELADARWVAS